MAFISSAYPLLTFTTREFVTTPVRGLAQVLKVSKPAITRALERLGALDLVRRRTDEADRRGGHWREFFNSLSQEQTLENILQLTVQIFADLA